MPQEIAQSIYQITYERYKKSVDDRISSLVKNAEPKSLYDPVNYILSGGGKRIRPMMVMLCCEIAGGDPSSAIDAGAALEILHNFTLVHDDIMDNASTRRGNETVHKKWNVNTAILAGDNLIAMAYKSLLKTNSANIKRIVEVFTEGVIEVCEGQSYDKDFELTQNVSSDEYLLMIKKKTAKLLETSAVIGALIGNAKEKEIEELCYFALDLGMAFQIQDDLLDITADEKDLGKKIGGDLIEGKKTFLLLNALENTSDPEENKLLKTIVSNKGIHSDEDIQIKKIKDIYEKNGILENAKKEIENYTKDAGLRISRFNDSNAKNMLLWFSEMLMNRIH
ncbi:polyprenyl synthetase family protein [soil metagenome]